jgi:hypothetical protein
MKQTLDDVMFTNVKLDLPEPLEQALSDRAAEAGVSLNLFLASVISQQVAKYEGECRGDYRYSGQP